MKIQLRAKFLIAVAVLIAVCPADAGATTIVLNAISNSPGHIGNVAQPGDIPTIEQASNAAAYEAMRRAADAWQSILLDNIVVNIWVDFASLGSGVLGNAGPNLVSDTYSSFSSRLVANTDPFLSNLPVGTLPVILPAGIAFTGNISMTYANAKALGYTDPILTGCNVMAGFSNSNGCDGVMQFSSTFPFDMNTADGVSPGTYDLEGIAMHEIGHILGFYSEVDTIGCMLDINNSCGLGPDPNAHVAHPGAVDVSVLDLYRFADCQLQPGCVQAEPTTIAQFAAAQRYLSSVDPAVFIAGDSRFGLAQGFYTSDTGTVGDGFQASHWRYQPTPIGLMDPNVASGEAISISAADQRAMQALGYQVASVPEPGPLVMMSSGCVLVFFLGRRRFGRKS